MNLERRGLQPIGLTNEHVAGFFGVTIAVLCLTTTFVGLRIYARKLRRTSFNSEDYMIFTALFFYFGQTACSLVQIFLGGAGHHVSELQPENLELVLQLLIPLAILYGIEMTLTKCSILILFARIFFVKRFRNTVYVVIGITIAWGIYAAMGTWILCTPIAFNWDSTIPGGHCANRNASYYAIGIIDVGTDIFIWLLPIPMVWNLQLPRGNKIGLTAIFGIGLVSIIISGLRTEATLSISFEDFTYTGTLGFLWSQIEPGFSIIVASSLVLRPVVDKWFPTRSKSRASQASKKLSRTGDAEYPLRFLQNGQTSTNATAQRTQSQDSRRELRGAGMGEERWKDDAVEDDELVLPGEEGILVRKQWTVRSEA